MLFDGIIDKESIVLELPLSSNARSLTISGKAELAEELDTAPFVHACVYGDLDRYQGGVVLQKKAKSFKLNVSGSGEVESSQASRAWKLELFNVDVENYARPATGYQIQVEQSSDRIENKENLVASIDDDNKVVFDYLKKLKTGKGWYKGDLHAHTTLSDGHLNLSEAAACAQSQALDFLFLSDHNLCHKELPSTPDVLFLPAVEITTGKGHFNVLCPEETFLFNRKDYSCEGTIKKGLSLGGAASINHPFMTTWEWLYDEMPLECVATMEVCTDPAWGDTRVYTEKALAMLSKMWNCGVDIYAVGGSDAHLKPHERYSEGGVQSIYGDPATFVYADGLSGNSLIEGLQKGRIYISRHSGLSFLINNGAVLPGDQVGRESLHYQLNVTDTNDTYTACLVADGAVIEEQAIDAVSGCSFSVDPAPYRWLRVDVRKSSGDFEGLINPVFTRKITPAAKTWGDLKQL